MRGLLVFWALAIACSSRSSSSDRAPPSIDDGSPPIPITHEVQCPGARAVWSGARVGDHEHYKTLSLEVAGAAKRWILDLEDIPRANWSFDIFSPDCRHVLLLQSRLGPYHIVRVDHLTQYVAGGPPDYELSGERDPKGISGTGNFQDGHWASNTEVTYAWGCCDPPIRTRFVLPPNK